MHIQNVSTVIGDIMNGQYRLGYDAALHALGDCNLVIIDAPGIVFAWAECPAES